MKQAILLHGTGGNDQDYFWFKDTQKLLEEKGYIIWWPQLPGTEKPNIETSLEFIQNNIPPTDDETIIIGHSSACPLILSFLQHKVAEAKLVILVAGYYSSGDKVSGLMIEETGYDWTTIKSQAKQIILINSDNDPWGCDDKRAIPVAEKLNAEFILAKGQGHMGSGTFDQPYREHKLVKEVISRETK